jgi:hypothetical protein
MEQHELLSEAGNKKICSLSYDAIIRKPAHIYVIIVVALLESAK